MSDHFSVSDHQVQAGRLCRRWHQHGQRPFHRRSVFNHQPFEEEKTKKYFFFAGITSSATHIRYTPGSSVWKKRTMLEKVLLVISATLLFVIFVLAFLLGAADDRIREARVPKNKRHCISYPISSKNCVLVASRGDIRRLETMLDRALHPHG